MPLPENVEDLRLIAEHYTACRALRIMGWNSVVFGILNIALGVCFTVFHGPINLLLVFMGLFMLAAGLWCLVLPGAEGIIVAGVAVILVGLWNIFATLINLLVGNVTSFWWAVFGIAMIASAVQCFLKYARYSKALRQPVSKEERAAMADLVKAILKADFKFVEDIIGYQVRTFGQQQQWRGRLGRNVAVFVGKTSKEALVAHREDVSITPHGKVLLGSTLKATVKIRQQTWEALISPTSFDRFRDWKFWEDDDAYYGKDDLADDEREPDTGIRRKGDREDESPDGIQWRQRRPEDEQ